MAGKGAPSAGVQILNSSRLSNCISRLRAHPLLPVTLCVRRCCGCQAGTGALPLVCDSLPHGVANTADACHSRSRDPGQSVLHASLIYPDLTPTLAGTPNAHSALLVAADSAAIVAFNAPILPSESLLLLLKGPIHLTFLD